MPKLTRRVLLASAFSAVLPAQKAEVSAFDLSLLDSPAVPNELFFVREHFPQPPDLSAAWKLSIDGKAIAFDDLAAAPSTDLAVTLECAENPVGGGMVSHADWSGVRLASLLKPTPAHRFARLTGADGFTRVIPIEKATHPDTLLVYRMNGEKLPHNHGFPVRAIIPGWYGMDSVKWLRAIDLLPADAVREGYIRQERSLLGGARTADPVTAIQVKSVFTRPQDGAFLTSRRFIVRGVAWAGENRIQRVEVSTDGGKTWLPARLDAARPYAWTPWSLDWRIPRPGEYELSVRAFDDKGRDQSGRAFNRLDDFERNSPQSIKVTVS